MWAYVHVCVPTYCLLTCMPVPHSHSAHTLPAFTVCGDLLYTHVNVYVFIHTYVCNVYICRLCIRHNTKTT